MGARVSMTICISAKEYVDVGETQELGITLLPASKASNCLALKKREGEQKGEVEQGTFEKTITEADHLANVRGKPVNARKALPPPPVLRAVCPALDCSKRRHKQGQRPQKQNRRLQRIRKWCMVGCHHASDFTAKKGAKNARHI